MYNSSGLRKSYLPIILYPWVSFISNRKKTIFWKIIRLTMRHSITCYWQRSVEWLCIIWYLWNLCMSRSSQARWSCIVFFFGIEALQFLRRRLGRVFSPDHCTHLSYSLLVMCWTNEWVVHIPTLPHLGAWWSNIDFLTTAKHGGKLYFCYRD